MREPAASPARTRKRITTPVIERRAMARMHMLNLTLDLAPMRAVTARIEAREQMKLRHAPPLLVEGTRAAFPKFDEYPLAKYDRGGPPSGGVATVT
jgi:hypothetical protein